jgi:polyhydroxyalkanoate synthesis regulator phasin
MEKVRSSRIEDWLAAFPIAEIEKDVRELRAEAEIIQIQMADLQERYGTVALELTKAEQALMFRERLMREIDDAIAATRPEVLHTRRPPRKRGKSAVLAIFHEGAPSMELRAEDVRDAMIARGWMNEDESTHSIQVALSRLTREERLERVRYGVYRLPVGDEAETQDAHGMGGNGSQGSGDLRNVTEGLPLALEGAPEEVHRAGS